jgi:hypothetical protein
LTELELGKLRQTQTDSGRASMLELLRGLSTSGEVLRPSELRLSLYTTRTKLGSTLEAKLTLSSHFLSGGVGGIYRGGRVKSVLWAKVALGAPDVRPTDYLGWSGGQVSWPHRLSHLGSSSYQLNMTRVESIISLASNPGGPAKEWAPPWVGWARAFCHVISPCHII